MTLVHVIELALREPWTPLPVGPDDEHGDVRPLYWVSILGRVAWVAPDAPPGRRVGVKAPRVEHRRGRRPHLRVNLATRTGPWRRRWRTCRVHRLVAAAWLPRLGGRLVRHRNGDGTDNRVGNLLRGTHADNLRDAYALGERAYTPDPVLGF